MNSSVQEVVVDDEIKASNIAYADAVVIKNRSFNRDAKRVQFVYNRGTYKSIYTFKNINDFKDSRDDS